MTLGNKLKKLIEEKDISQKQVANKLNIAVSTFNGYVQDYREPDFKTLIAVAQYFSVSTDYLIGNISLTMVDNTLNEVESEIIRLFRELTIDQQELLIEQVKLYIRHNTKRASFDINLPNEK
jgi:transcriptional regulator with XRE-family HTH domain